ncbi:MFS transporter [Paraburkholderia unamae]|uniref:MFS transporter n=1 Tax=Paraburkholderia unamae TaxID=219649 RepID=A0ABX5KLH2_9BURK|nr:MFS transporter [Paraburkholderia unamae]PVX82863.1 MFS transporter [Paraburkholderia unamae]RAR61202.1 MFS transporter [Paraburkholderia unamae]CAG9269086.1 Major facilitator transporter [Paraburkholderia unamae]
MSTSTERSDIAAHRSENQPVRASIAAFLGTTVEWYDFYIYGNAAALVFDKLFFPQVSSYVGTLASFATFAVGFLARPIGGIVFGHLGDKLGRKKSLMATLMLMAASTVGVGLLPTYEQAGALSVCLLLLMRVLQGIAVGGEWGGAVLIAGEHAPKHRRTFFASFAQLGSPAGLLLAMLVFGAVSRFDHATLLDWGWRLPFLGSVVLFAVGFFVRAGVKESPEFHASKKERKLVKMPLVEVLRHHWVVVLLAMGANSIGVAGAYFTNTFMLSYTTHYLGMSASKIINVLTLAAVIQFLWQPVAAKIAERFGTVRCLLLSAAGSVLIPYPMFMLVSTQNTWLMLIGVMLAIATKSSFYSIIAGYMTEIFPAHIRYSAISLAYQLCGAIIAGFTPFVGSILAERFHGSWIPLAVFYSALSAASLICVAIIARRKTSFAAM